MPLTLSLFGQGPTGPVQEVRSLDHGKLSLGRGSANDWVLPDPDGQLSRMHCTIAFLGGRYVLTDHSTNGVFLNGAAERMPRESQVVLADGDEIRLGNHVIRVSDSGPAAGLAPAPAPSAGADPLALDPFEDPLPAPPQAPFRHPPRIEAPMPRGLDPFDVAEQGRAPQDIDRFQGKAPDPSWSGAAQRDDVDAANQFYRPPRVVQPISLSDKDLDDLIGDLPIAAGAGAPVMPPPAAPAPGLPPDIDFDALIGDLVPRPAAPPAAPPPVVQAVPPPVAAPPAVVQVTPLPPASPPLPATAEAVANPFEEPDRPIPPPVATPPAGAAPAPRAGADQGEVAARLLAAFLDGAGNPRVDLGAEDPEAYFRLIGQLMRMMVENLREVLMSRAEVKRAFGIEQTMLQARNNNALKFSVTPEDAVAAILQPGRPGYLPPLQATEEAFKDLTSHQLAVMAGVQAAMAALLKRFDPAAIEARITGKGLLGGWLPGGGKARHWEAFCAIYQDIAREAEEDFQAVFGRGFARAYQEQERKL